MFHRDFRLRVMRGGEPLHPSIRGVASPFVAKQEFLSVVAPSVADNLGDTVVIEERLIINDGNSMDGTSVFLTIVGTWTPPDEATPVEEEGE